jgi:hypothetical protein
VIPVHRFLPEALAGILRNAPLTPEKTAFAWRVAVGPSIDRVTRVSLHDGVLHVQARDTGWKREIDRSAGLIRARLDALLGEGVVASIETELGNPLEARRDSSSQTRSE